MKKTMQSARGCVKSRVTAMILVLACMLCMLCACTASGTEESEAEGNMTSSGQTEAESAADEEEPFEIEDLEGKKIAVQTGTVYAQYIEELYDDVDIEYFDQTSDMVTALLSGKIDAFSSDEPVIRYIAAQNDQIAYRKECYVHDDYAYMLNKDSGAEIQKQLNEYIAKRRADGSLDAMTEEWFDPDREHEIKEYTKLPDTNGTIHMAVDAEYIPFEYVEIVSLVKATAIVGYVAVEDLTKIGDIVRSRTFEAFFPLISVAVIYFVLSAVLIALVNMAARHFDPTLRKKEDILKGVVVSD